MYLSQNDSNRILLWFVTTCGSSALGAWVGSLVGSGNGGNYAVALGILVAGIIGWATYTLFMSLTSRNPGSPVFHAMWGMVPGIGGALGCMIALVSSSAVFGAIAALIGFPLLIWFMSSTPASSRGATPPPTKTDNNNQTPRT